MHKTPWTRKCNFTIQVVAVILMIICMIIPPVYGDAMYFKNGRYDGKATELTLSAEQQNQVIRTRILTLSEAQKRTLLKAAGVSPSELLIDTVWEASTSCTCFTYNAGIWLALDKIEVPHAYLISDEKAAECKRQIEEMHREGVAEKERVGLMIGPRGRIFKDGRLISLEKLQEYLIKNKDHIYDVYCRLPPNLDQLEKDPDFPVDIISEFCEKHKIHYWDIRRYRRYIKP